MRFALAALLIAAAAVSSAEEPDLEDLFEEFEEEGEIVIEESTDDEATRFWDLDGFLLAQLSYHYVNSTPASGSGDYDPIALVRNQLNLELDLDLPREWKARIAGRAMVDWAYEIHGRENFTDRALDRHEREIEPTEVWVAGELLRALDLKFGRQIVNWGRSDTIRVIDVLNPLDNREPGLVDVVDLRLPVTMTRLDYHHGPWTLTGIAIHEIRRNKDPVLGSEFYPFSLAVGRNTPSSGGGNTEWAAALSGVFSGWDFSLHRARYFEDTGHLDLFPLPLRLEFARQTLYGVSAQKALGNWLLKGEGTLIKGIEMLRVVGGIPRGVERKDRYDVFGGVEYLGFNDTTLALEVVNRHIAGFDRTLSGAILGFPGSIQRDRVQYVGRLTRSFMHERLDLTFLASIIGDDAEDGAIYRLALDYELREALNIGVGIVTYNGGNLATLSGIKNNDRLYLTAKYSF